MRRKQSPDVPVPQTFIFVVCTLTLADWCLFSAQTDPSDEVFSKACFFVSCWKAHRMFKTLFFFLGNDVQIPWPELRPSSVENVVGLSSN